MKKSLVILVLLVFAVAIGFADPVPVSKDRNIYFYGKIGVGEILFGAEALTSSTSAVLLLSDEMNPNGTDTYPSDTAPGVKIGKWTFDGVNQEAASYTITYTFGNLELDGENPLGFQLKEDVVGASWLDSSDTTTYSAPSGNPEESRDIYARLTVAGREAAEGSPAGLYTVNIGINLSTN